MKWPKRTAQGFSPGLAAKAFDLKVSTEARYPGLQADYIAHLNGLISVKLNPNRLPFQGVPSKKPLRRAKALGYGLSPLRVH